MAKIVFETFFAIALCHFSMYGNKENVDFQLGSVSDLPYIQLKTVRLNGV